MFGAIEEIKYNADKEAIQVVITIYRPAPTYLNPGDKGYDEVVLQYQIRMSQYNGLHLGSVELNQEVNDV